MEFAALGLLTGLLFGLPLGPTGALCAQRCREEGWQQGVLTALGASAAEGVHAALALGLFSLRVTVVSSPLDIPKCFWP